MKKIILFALAALSISTAQAQVTISPVGGLNMSGVTVDYGGSYSDEIKMKPGFCVGAFVDLPSKSKLSFQTGLLYKLNGYRVPVYTGWAMYPDDMAHIRINTLEVPIKLIRSFNGPKGSRFFVGAGPYVALNVAASVRIHAHYYDALGNPIGARDTVQKVDIGDHGETKRMDMGVGINAGFRAAKGLLICLQGQYGILNMGDGDFKVHNYNFGIVAGYSFKLKKHKAHSEVPAEAKQ
jgi:hypothetical protein